MLKIFTLLSVVIILLAFNYCGTKPVRESDSEQGSKKEVTKSMPMHQKLMGLDKSVATQFVAQLPDDKNLVVLTGRPGITGNEPFLNIALYVNDQESVLISGNQKLMDYLTNQHHTEISVAGKMITRDNQKWIQVMYVKTK